MTEFELLLKQLGDRISKNKTSYIFTPYKIASDMLELFPDEVWDSESKFLDIQCKSGVLLYLIYNKLMTHERVIKQIPDPVLRNNHILGNQLYGIAPDETCKFIAIRMVYGYLRHDSNIIHIESFTDKVLKTNKEEFKALINKEFNREMKFTAIVGNPPYNNDQYIPFVTKAKDLDPDYICMITPAKWQAKTDGKPKGSKTPDKNEEFRKNIVPYMSKIVFYPDSKNVFDISEWGGITYFTLDKNIHKEKQIKTICSKNEIIDSDFELHDETVPILYNRKILSIIGKVGTLGEEFKQSLYVKNTDHGEISIAGTLGFSRQTFVGEQERGEALKQAGYAEVMQGKNIVGYKKIDELYTTINIDKYKCITSIIVSGSTNIDEKGFNKYFNAYNIGPYQVPKGSFPVLKYFNTYEECDYFVKYNQTKLFQFLFALGVCGTTLTKEFFRFIPDPQDWTLIYEDKPLPGYTPDNSGIYIDKDGNKHCSLYKKYNLSDEEIAIIESVIKERK